MGGRETMTDEPTLDDVSRSTLARMAESGRVYDIAPSRAKGALHLALSFGALSLVGVAGLGVGAAWALGAAGAHGLGRGLGVVAVLLIPVWAGALRWHRFARRLSSHGALDLLLHGRGPFFLYLRPFVADRENPTTQEMFEHAVTGRRDVGEEDLARMLRRTGPLLALGRPGETLPPLGARRFYVTPAPADRESETKTWRAVITALARQARLVILRPGVSEGVHWEYGLCLDRVPRNQLVVRIAPDDWEGYYGLADFFRLRLGIDLPRHPGEYVVFGSDRTPVTGNSLGRLLDRVGDERIQPPLSHSGS
jgi:hypothetical protein